MAKSKKKSVKVLSKRKPAEKKITKGYKVSYSMLDYQGKWKRFETGVVYRSKQLAQQYADQLNRSNRFKNALVKRA